MAVRIRRDGRVLCAAMHPVVAGDTYIDDGLHYRLSAELGVLVTEPMRAGGRGGHAAHGEWWWRNDVPDDVTPERRGFDPRAVAERAMNSCCEGDPWPTARNLARVYVVLTSLAARRCADRLRHQPRGLFRWRRDPAFGGRP